MVLQYFRYIHHKEFFLCLINTFFCEKDFKSGSLNNCLWELLFSKTVPYFHRILFFSLQF